MTGVAGSHFSLYPDLDPNKKDSGMPRSWAQLEILIGVRTVGRTENSPRGSDVAATRGSNRFMGLGFVKRVCVCRLVSSNLSCPRFLRWQGGTYPIPPLHHNATIKPHLVNACLFVFLCVCKRAGMWVSSFSRVWHIGVVSWLVAFHVHP